MVMFMRQQQSTKACPAAVAQRLLDGQQQSPQGPSPAASPVNSPESAGGPGAAEPAASPAAPDPDARPGFRRRKRTFANAAGMLVEEEVWAPESPAAERPASATVEETDEETEDEADEVDGTDEADTDGVEGGAVGPKAKPSWAVKESWGGQKPKAAAGNGERARAAPLFVAPMCSLAASHTP